MTVKIGIIGAGGIGQAHVKRLSGAIAGTRVTGINDIDQERARAVAPAAGATAYATDTELIASPEVDAVIVASYGPAHEASVVAAVEAGKPVLCEKPLSPTADACLRIMEAEQRAGRRLVTVGFMRRFDPAYGEIKAVIDSGELGVPLIVHNRHRNPTVPESYTADMAINDTAIHEVDTMRWLLGEEIVSARVDRPRSTSNRFEHLQDPLVLVMTTESGAVLYDEIFVNIRYGYDIRCEVVLETGTVALTAQAGIERRDAAGARHRVAVDYNDRFRLAFLAEVQQWVDAARRGEHAGSTAWDGYAAAAVCDAGVRALRNGETVPVSLIDKPAFYA
jgi:myo-inositol 2-dehydrogenase/D-chiro-inositol 1-dehydrogenase